MINKNKYAVVFDLDNTLGSFSQLYTFWNLTKVFLKNSNLQDKYFFYILDKFPNFLRPQIIKLLKIIKNKKIQKVCNYVMIYTNNHAPNYWCDLIKKYLEYKLNYKLFDKTIRAFKIDGKKIEICRTSYTKSYRDFINCTKLPKNTKVCFIDDVYHEQMIDENVLYIKINPYHHNENYSIMCKKFYNKNKHLFNKSVNEYENFIILNTSNENLNFLNKSNKELNMEKLFTHNMLIEINKFFNMRENKTRKNKTKLNKTHKI